VVVVVESWLMVGEGKEPRLGKEQEQEERHKGVGRWMVVEVPRAGWLARE